MLDEGKTIVYSIYGFILFILIIVISTQISNNYDRGFKNDFMKDCIQKYTPNECSIALNNLKEL